MVLCEPASDDPEKINKNLTLLTDVVSKALTLHNTPDLGLQGHTLIPTKRRVEAHNVIVVVARDRSHNLFHHVCVTPNQPQRTIS